MSFTEINYRHQVVRVDLDGDSVVEITSILVPRPVELLRIPAQPAPLDEVLDALRALDLSYSPSSNTWPYLQVRVQSNTFDPTLRVRIESICVFGSNRSWKTNQYGSLIWIGQAPRAESIRPPPFNPSMKSSGCNRTASSRNSAFKSFNESHPPNC